MSERKREGKPGESEGKEEQNDDEGSVEKEKVRGLIERDVHVD